MSEVEEGEEGENTSSLPGPPPNPSSIPSVVRAVGNLDLNSKVDELGFSKKTEPNINAIIEFLNEVELVLNKLKNKNIAFICASGARSEIVANYFIDKNYNNISHIPDGIVGKENNGWLYLGHPIKSYDEESKAVN